MGILIFMTIAYVVTGSFGAAIILTIFGMMCLDSL